MNENENVGFIPQPDLNNPEQIYEENGTYCRIGSNVAGMAEVDLQSIKERGVENRHISLTVTGFDETKSNVIRAEMLFLDEPTFKKFQDFISKLKWTD